MQQINETIAAHGGWPIEWEIAMARQKKPRVKLESGMTGPGEEAETKAIQNWLRMMDKPLAKEKPDREDAGPRGQ